ncbi:hypothetical protein BVG19_g2817 [[Candida] boidinii]|nr:hypothetical protein BVG19_g2817 [[Candida] boidinii]OWB52994.1 hypothetical protein B5S27_g4579 [[Candida] boidinii]
MEDPSTLEKVENLALEFDWSSSESDFEYSPPANSSGMKIDRSIDTSYSFVLRQEDVDFLNKEYSNIRDKSLDSTEGAVDTNKKVLNHLKLNENLDADEENTNNTSFLRSLSKRVHENGKININKERSFEDENNDISNNSNKNDYKETEHLYDTESIGNSEDDSDYEIEEDFESEDDQEDETDDNYENDEFQYDDENENDSILDEFNVLDNSNDVTLDLDDPTSVNLKSPKSRFKKTASFIVVLLSWVLLSFAAWKISQVPVVKELCKTGLNPRSYISADSMTSINNKFRYIEEHINELTLNQKNLNSIYHDLNSQVVSNKNSLDSKIQSLEDQVTFFIDDLAVKFTQISSSQIDNVESMNLRIDNLKSELSHLKDNYSISNRNYTLGSESEDKGLQNEILIKLQALESEINNYSDQFNEIKLIRDKIYGSIDSLENNLENLVIKNLPSTIPVLNKNGRLELIPEFTEFIKELIDIQLTNTTTSNAAIVHTDLSWDEFFKKNKAELNDLITKVAINELKLIDKSEIQLIIENIKINLENDLKLMKDNIESELIKNLIKQTDNKTTSSGNNSSLYSSSIEYFESSKFANLLKSVISKELNTKILNSKNSNIYNFANYEKGARIISYLTKTPKLPRKRTKILDRIFNGWLDFIKRNFINSDKNSRKLIGFGHIDLLSNENSPANVILENNQYWQFLTNSLPVTIGIRLSEVIYLQDIGIYYPKNIDNILNASTKKISLLASPSDKNQYAKLLDKMSIFYNQDFSLKNLKGFVKLSEFEYNINNNENYQSFPLDHCKDILNDIPIKYIVLIIESNCGNDYITILHTVKAFGLTESEMYTTKMGLNFGEYQNEMFEIPVNEQPNLKFSKILSTNSNKNSNKHAKNNIIPNLGDDIPI